MQWMSLCRCHESLANLSTILSTTFGIFWSEEYLTSQNFSTGFEIVQKLWKQAEMLPSHTCNSLPDRYAVVKYHLFLNHVIIACNMGEFHWIQEYKCSLNTRMKSKMHKFTTYQVTICLTWTHMECLQEAPDTCNLECPQPKKQKEGQQRVYFILGKPSDTDNKVSSMNMQMRSASFPEQELLTEEARSSFASILANPKSPARAQYGQWEASL